MKSTNMKPETDKKNYRRALSVITDPQVLLFNCWKMLCRNFRFAYNTRLLF